MKLSFDDEESFKETVESLCFNNPPSDANSLQQTGSMLPQVDVSEGNEDNNAPIDPSPNILRRVGSTSSSSQIQVVEL